MKKLLLASAAFFACLAAALAPAELVENGEFGAGIELMSYHYHESHFMRLDGAQFGAYGSFSYRLPDIPSIDQALVGQLYLSYVGGKITYDGGYQSGGSLKGDVGNGIFNLRPLIGWAFEDVNLFDFAAFEVMPYTGLCYRYLVNHLEDLGSSGYKRQQSYLYWPLAVSTSFPLPSDDRWRLGAKLEFDILLSGKNTSGDDEFTQDSGWGFRFAPNARYDISEDFSVCIELFWRYWLIGESDTIHRGGTESVEPENATSELGFDVGVIF